MDKEFVIGTLFDKPNLKWIADRKFDKSKDLSQEQTKEFDLPLVNAKNGNNGIMYFGRSADFSYVDGGIDIVNDGAVSAGNVYPQPHKIGVLYNAYIITLKNDDYNTNRPVLEYLSCVIEKNIKHRFSYSDKAGWDKVKEITIPLPIKVDENDNPIIDDKHFYHEEGFVPDFEYMEKYIAELEQERIAELEQYLVVTGLNDYELTDEDIETLSLSGFGGTQERDSEDAVKVCKEMREFRCGDILTKYNPKFYGSPNTYVGRKAKSTTEPDALHTVPLTCAKYDNNGVMYYGETNLFEAVSNCLVMIRDGAVSTGLVFAHKDPVGVLSHSYILKCVDNVDFHTLQYLSTIMTFSLYDKYDRGNPSLWENRVENDLILLPSKTDTNNKPIIDTTHKYHPEGYIPDWDFMEKYIRAIEKIVIADVVKFKDEMISKTKEVVNTTNKVLVGV